MIKNYHVSSKTVNWHFIDQCNMKCRFCFADKSCKKSQNSYRVVLDHCQAFDRINFVGGEPTIDPNFFDMVEYAQGLGLKTSLVTNGFFAVRNPKIFESCFSKMSTVGLSIDSLIHDTNIKIGRHVNDITLSKDQAIEFCKRIKDLGVELKINTVVTKENLSEDFSEFIELVKPDRWKIFQVLPVGNSGGYKDLLVTNEEYECFLQKHSHLESVIHAEDSDLITNSYIMINADGFFMDTAPYTIQSHQNSLYDSNSNIIEELNKMNYDLLKYDQRYEKSS